MAPCIHLFFCQHEDVIRLFSCVLLTPPFLRHLHNLKILPIRKTRGLNVFSKYLNSSAIITIFFIFILTRDIHNDITIQYIHPRYNFSSCLCSVDKNFSRTLVISNHITFLLILDIHV